jgi:hypothetical protein
MKILPLFGWIGMCASLVFASPGAGLGAYQAPRDGRQQYTFKAWPRGDAVPLLFKSTLYLKDSVSSVRIDEGRLFPSKDETPVRRTADFDSLKVFYLGPLHSVNTPEGPAYFRDTVWVPAQVIGRMWIFKKVSGRLSLYTTAPGRGAYRGMDTGTGIQPYSEQAVRAKIVTSPRAAQLLRQEKIGYTVAWTMGLGGAALVAAGAATNGVADGSPGTGIMLAGLGVAVFSWVPHFIVQDRLESAIEAYNAEAIAR